MTDYLKKYSTPAFRKFQEGGAAAPPPEGGGQGGSEVEQVAQAYHQIGDAVASGEFPVELAAGGLQALQEMAQQASGGQGGQPQMGREGAKVYRRGGSVVMNTTRAKLIPRR